ncbi:MAG: hypothetical protein GY757_18870 [bacterium]|nr:hypothetical protein [bacterium]
MKKILLILFILFILPGVSFAANASSTAAFEFVPEKPGASMALITITMEADDATGAFTAIDIGGSETLDSNDINIADRIELVKGWYLREICFTPGDTAPDVDSDCVVTMDGVDRLDGNGTGQIHNTSTLCTVFQTDGQAKPAEFTDTFTVTPSGNTTNSADLVIIIKVAK